MHKTFSDGGHPITREDVALVLSLDVSTTTAKKSILSLSSTKSEGPVGRRMTCKALKKR